MEIIKIREHGEAVRKAAEWFSFKWGIPAEEYRKSMEECLAGRGGVPQWYLAVDNGIIAGGIGVIENDFHERKDLAPNICALYVEQEYRRRGVAGSLLKFACADMLAMGTDTLYLITEHTSFYEKYGWRFLCEVKADGEEERLRMYIHKQSV